MKRYFIRILMQSLFLFLCLLTWQRTGQATTLIVPSDNDLISESRAIVLAKVIAIESSFDGRGNIFTYTTLRVQDVLKGPINDRRIVVKELGGAVGGILHKVDGAAQFSLGERVLLYLGTWPDGVLRVDRMFLGKFSIVLEPATNRTVIVHYSAADQAQILTRPASGTLTEYMELSDYLARVRAKLAINSRQSQDTEAAYYRGVPILSKPPNYNIKGKADDFTPQYTLHRAGRWFEPDVGQSVYFSLNPTNAPPTDIESDVMEALGAWSSVSGSNLRLAYGGLSELCANLNGLGNVISFDNCDGHAFTPGLVAVSDISLGPETKVVKGQTFRQIGGAFISFNPLLPISTPSEIREALTHELGHAIGLGHSWEPGAPTATPAQLAATMYYALHRDGRGASLRQDDLNGVTAIYPTPAYDGYFEAADCTTGSISGWIWDSTHPNDPVNAWIYLDQTVIQVTANQYRPDIGKGNGLHGFNYPIPTSRYDGKLHNVWVVAATGVSLPGGPKTFTCPAMNVYQGYHEGADCVSLWGWAWDQNSPNNTVSVDIYEVFSNGTTSLKATTPANLFRSDLVGKGNGYHAFSYRIPASWKDGQQHTYRLRFAGTNQSLNTTPRSITCNLSTPAYEGYHDGADCNSVWGWAWNVNAPNSSVTVEVYERFPQFGDSILASGPASYFRQDLLEAQKGNGYHAFIFALPSLWKDGHPHEIRVRVAGTNIDLGWTPRTIACQP